MARQNEVDPWARIRELERRLEILERHSPLENASITSGSLRVGTPEGIRVKDGGTVTVENADGIDVKSAGGVKFGVGGAGNVTAAEGIKAAEGASFKAGAAEVKNTFGGHVKVGPTSIGSDGVVRNDDGEVVFGHKVSVVGGIKSSGQVDAASVLATWNGARHTIEQITGWLQGDINSVSGRTTTAQGRADDAYSLASTAKSATDNHGPRIGSLEANTVSEDTFYSAVDVLMGADAKIVAVYNAHIDTYHPGGTKINL